jgi:glutamine synthetase
LTQTKEDVLKAIEENDVKFIRLWFTDILGQLKSFAITKEEVEGAFENGMGFDGSSILGFQGIEESDMVAMPDPSTFRILPWRPKELSTARMFVDVLTPEGKPYEGDPRYVLKRNLERAAKKGFKMYVGPELEFFLFRDSNGTEIIDQGGYFDLTPLDLATDIRRDIVLALNELGIRVEYSHHEVGPSQHEIDLRYNDALAMAEDALTYKLAAKEIARKNELYITFMPKPIFGVNGSGMHTHQSLFAGDRNAFFDADDEYNLSKVGRGYIAGVLAHAKEICSICSQTINSYKRLVPGYEAPVYIAWARRNRSALVRVPMYQPGKELATRMELRSPDPACNPYLAFAVMLAAGLEGIEKGYELPEPVEKNIYKMSEAERKEKGIEALPENLKEAIDATENSDVVRRALGEHVFENFISLKRAEWDDYRVQVTPYELDKYLSIL